MKIKKTVKIIIINEVINNEICLSINLIILIF